jgi:two-component system, LuxR family, sensor histidine kinase DctS
MNPESDEPAEPAEAAAAPLRRWRRPLLWGALVVLLGVAQSLLLVLSLQYESARAQDDVDSLAAEAAVALRRDLLVTLQQMQMLMWAEPSLVHWRDGAGEMLGRRREVLRIERRDEALRIVEAVDSPLAPRLFSRMARESLDIDTAAACRSARRSAAPAFSRSYFVPLPDGHGVEVMDLCVPVSAAGADDGYLVGSFSLASLLEGLLTPVLARQHELALLDGDGSRLARAGRKRGGGHFVAERLVELPGTTLRLRIDSAAGQPSLLPNVTTTLVLVLSVALFAVVLALARDGRRRARAERRLAETLAFRQAMEDSLVTGLRARDLRGAITYVNPAFCAMVGFSATELLAPSPQPVAPAPPYWPPEFAAEYGRRQQALLRDGVRPGAARESREGFETVFMRKNGERFPVMIYESPLLDSAGRHAGWMSAVLDISAQRRIEELSRQQQERLQATARLATVGEMASLLSHELNQPLAAIASYASGGLNLIDDALPAKAPDSSELRELLRLALARIGEQAERAGRVIKSVNDFVRPREQPRESVGADELVDAVLPLVRLQARKSAARVVVEMPPAPARQLTCDRTMIEQVLLNLCRNAIQAMETATPAAQRELTIRARQTHPNWVSFSVIDAGPGIAPEVAARLFTPFFTTRSEGMGLGLSLCRTVIEQHGGALDFGPGPRGQGTEFRFTLPSARSATGATVGNASDVGSSSAAESEDGEPHPESSKPSPSTLA